MSSWFHRLRRKTAVAGAIASAAEPPAPPPCSPNRASYYVPSRDRALALPRRPAAAAREDNPKLWDTRFPPPPPRSPQPSDIVFDVVVAARRDDRFSPAPELKLRPILTRPPPRPDAAGSSSAAASPTGRARLPPPRFHFDAAKGGAAPPDHHRRKKAEEEEEACTRSQSRKRRRRLRRAGRLRWVYESVVVVKESADPEEDFLESMAEMIAANGVRSPRGLEELLACYIALNAADHHRAIVAAFRRAWLHLHLHRAPPPTPTPMTEPRNCMHESCIVVD
ncbi:hypothetical protein BDA96_02G437700 [Sorghum bicolor]|jgi:uncharacterized protein (TIGR01568 family)|uniref:Transcription repressor n=1 Tax=Sorghum bicolor TaxID=4558 RepID=A0A921RW44_SORBI|nr:transcription repressor OFP8 [Sorghum bicolor]KAG0546322.1 hypothetical protein BDA96_02G437700 [Sorghum bicolor]|eukprot:XP_021308566.1 transcription repressor OFP8 [Sorghum bicolor]